jgi:hypothetical protein
MAGAVDAFLKISIAISVLGAAASVGYYFGLSSRERRSGCAMCILR